MTVIPRTLLLALALAGPAPAADLRGGLPRTGRFLARCEDLGQFCFADACGRNQIEAALNCRALCPNSAILGVVPGACPSAPADGRGRLRTKG